MIHDEGAPPPRDENTFSAYTFAAGAVPIIGTRELPAGHVGSPGHAITLSGECTRSDRTRTDVSGKTKAAWPAIIDDTEVPCQSFNRLVAERSPAVEFSARSQGFIAAIEGSESLKARARAIRGELAHAVAAGLAESVGRGPGDPDARLAGDLLLATCALAYVEAHRVFRQGRSR